MADTDVPETSYGQQQDARLEFTTAKGDIRDLYAYYRLSDHELTNVTLKGKVHQKTPVWFEGHMNWAFKKCTFKESFYFGVEGDRLAEDIRGTEQNPEPFPPYGHNGLNFTECSFGKSFEIRENCNVVFYDCAFESLDQEELEVTIGDSSKVEFINCQFKCVLIFDEYTDVNFRNCSFDESKSNFIRATDHCKIVIDKCDLSNSPDDIFFDLSGDCSLVVNSCESIVSDKTDIIHASGFCHVRITAVPTITCSGRLLVMEDGKFEALNTENFVTTQNALECVRSEIFIRNTESLVSEKLVIQAEDSVIRLADIGSVVSSQDSCFDLQGSKIFCKNGTTYQAYKKVFSGEDSSVEATNIQTITGREGAFHLSGITETHLREVQDIISENNDAINLSGGHRLFVEGTANIAAPQLRAIVLDEAEIYAKDVYTIVGKLGAIAAEDSYIGLKNVVSIIADVGEPCIAMTGCSYNFEQVGMITGATGGVKAVSCRGIIYGVEEISGDQGPGVEITNCSGPTEWEAIAAINSSQDKALEVYGDLKRLRMTAIGAIETEMEIALSWHQTSGQGSVNTVVSVSSQQGRGMDILVEDGEAYFSSFGDISSEQEDALVLHAQGGAKIRVREVAGLTSEQGTPLVIQGEGSGEIVVWSVTGAIHTQEANAVAIALSGNSKMILKDTGGISSVEGTALQLTVGDEALGKIEDVSSIYSTEGDGVVFSVGEDARLELQRIGDMTSVEGSVVTGDTDGWFSMDDVESIQTTEGLAISITGSGVKSNVWINKVPTISGEEIPGSLVSITDVFNITLKNINEVSAQAPSGYLLFLRGQSQYFGKIDVIDVADISGKCRGGVYLRYAEKVNLYCTSSLGRISCEEGVTACVLNAYTGETFIKNFSEIVSGDNTLMGVYDYQSSKVVLNNVETISAKQAINFLGTGEYYLIDCKELKAPESGQAAVEITGDPIVDIRRGLGTTIESKDENSYALHLNATNILPELRIYNVTIPASKGKALINSFTLDVHSCTFNGSSEIASCVGKISKSSFNCGLDISGSDLHLIKSPINLGQNSGPNKDLAISDSVIVCSYPEISGSETVEISDSIVEFRKSDSRLTGAANQWDISNTIFRGEKVAFDKDLTTTEESVTQLTKVDIENSSITLSGPDQVIEGHHLSVLSLDIGEDSSGILSHGVIAGDLTVQAGSAFLQLGKTYGNNISLGNSASGAFLGMSTLLSGEITTGDDASLVLLGVEGDDTDLDIGDSTAVLLNRVTPGAIDLAQNVALIANGVEHDGGFTTVDDAAVILNNYQQNTGKLTIGPRSAGILVEAFSQQTEIQQSSGVAIIGCDLRQVSIDLDVGILAADWECNNGNIATGANTAIIGARMRLPGEWQLGLNNGFISACGTGSWNTSANGIGAVIARHDQNITIGGDNIGVVGASLDNNVTFSSEDSGLVLAGGYGTYSGAGAVVGAFVDTVDALTAVISLGTQLTASDLVGVKITTINNHDAGVVVGSGGTWEAAEGTVVVGGGYGAISAAASAGLLTVGGAVTSITGGNNSGLGVVGTSSTGNTSVGNFGGILRVGVDDYTTLAGGSQAGIATIGGKLLQIKVPSSGGVLKVSTLQNGSTGWDGVGGVVSAGLPQTTVPTFSGGVFAAYSGSSVGADGAAIIAGGTAGGNGAAIAATGWDSYTPLNTGAARTGVIACLNALQIYNAVGTLTNTEEGLITASGGVGTGVYLGYNLYTRQFVQGTQSRGAITSIFDFSPEIHHNYHYGIID